jgi:gluconolactonase
LYVADSEQPEVRALPLSADGTPSQWKKLIDRSSDGMGIDDAGNLYLTNGAGVEVFRPDGSKWGAIALPTTPTNASFGGADRKTLYITLPNALYRVNTNIPGLP